MLFPKTKMAHTSVYHGTKSDEGWLVLDIGNMDLEGVTKIFIDIKDVEDVKEKSQRGLDVLSSTKRLLGG